MSLLGLDGTLCPMTVAATDAVFKPDLGYSTTARASRPAASSRKVVLGGNRRRWKGGKKRDHLPTLPAVHEEALVWGEDLAGFGQLRHAHKACVGQAHGPVRILAQEATHVGVLIVHDEIHTVGVILEWHTVNT